MKKSAACRACMVVLLGSALSVVAGSIQTSVPPATVTSPVPAVVTSSVPAAVTLPVLATNPVPPVSKSERPDTPLLGSSDFTEPIGPDSEKAWSDSFYERYIQRRLSVGARVSSFKLEETERPADPEQKLTFLGHLSKLNADQESTPRVVVGYRLCPYLSLEYTQDRVAASAQNYDVDSHPGPIDGTVVMSGPIYSVMARLPLYERFFPYVGIGYAPWKADFEHAPWWHLGWGSPEDYASAGSPGTSTGKLRHMVVEDDSSSVLTLGLAIQLTRILEVDVMMRRMDLLSKGEFYHQFGAERTLVRTGEFPMSHEAYGVSLSLVF